MTVLLLVLLTGGAAHAFSAADWFGASVHDRITRRAELSLEGTSYVPFHRPERSLHPIGQLQDGIEFALSAERVQIASRLRPDLFPATGEKVRDAIPTSLYSADHHFFRDGRWPGARSADAFGAGVDHYQTRLARAVRRAEEGAYGCAVIDVGLALHTVQDFYAHSNVSELVGDLPPFAAVEDAAALAEIDRCLAPGSTTCEPERTSGALLLTFFPNYEPVRGGEVGWEHNPWPGSVDCEGNTDASCYGQRMDTRSWREAVEASCARLTAAGPTEETYAHVCYSKEVRHPRIRPSVPEAWPASWRLATKLATERTAQALTWLHARLAGRPVPHGSRCREQDAWACLTVADRRECQL